ncbi:hypothetical protein CAP35_00200 [Chitinophagaceae bacterium IBVUCB1]|nr:hypothetical protein CAP35_00200 [Chitinophagaceae bacterium IBVUCB1]
MVKRKEQFYKRSLMCLAVSLLSHQASAQLHTSHRAPDNLLTQAAQQYESGMYANAAQSAKQYLDAVSKQQQTADKDAVDRAGYYRAIAALKTEEQNCDATATNYINKTANPAYKERTAFAVAQYYFKHNQLASAIYYYELAGIANLSNKEIADAKFELAYCYFNVKQFDRARELFQSIKELADGKYYLAGNYYYGLLAYNKNDYEDALKSFERIANDKDYKIIVPYYVAEIYYFTGNKAKALQEAKRLIQSREKLYYDNELHLLAAQILFEEKRYKEALPYFEHYYNNVDRIRKEDLYEMAYCYYNEQQWEQAIDKFSQLSDTRDSLSQTAMYLLGDCHLKMNDSKSARNAFGICADMPFNSTQREAALLLAAKLSYAMGYNDEALTRINDLLTSYPSSAYKDEAKTMLSDLLVKTNKYTEAYAILSDVNTKDAAYWVVQQKVAYGYAMAQLQAGNLLMADSLLSVSLQRTPDEKYEQAANFWKGELAYKTRRFADVINYCEQFVTKALVANKAEGIAPNATLHNAYTNMGYAAMEQQDFEAAQWYFAQAQMKATGSSTMDAVLREADAVFMQKGYMKAIGLYEKVIAANGEDADYARYQKGIVLGVIGKRAEKAAMMQGLMNTKPASKYANDARYELALVQIEEDKYQQAIATLTPLATAQDNTRYAARAWMKIGFCHQQQKADEKAIEAYKHIVTEHTNAEERTTALDALRSLYIDNNQPQAFAQLLKDNNIRLTDDNTLDTTYYSAAEALYASGNWDKAKQSLGAYLKQYPDGVFATKAHYYKAETHYQLNEMKDALAHYDAVLQKGWSDFAERSALKAASIAAFANNHPDAFRYYGMLRNYAMGKENLQEAYMGMMRTGYHQKKYNEAAAYADTLLQMPSLNDALVTEGSYIKAKSLYEAGRQDEAYVMFGKMTGNKKSIVAAEANYYTAEAALKNNKLKDAEELANKAVKLAGGNDVITLKSYLIIADVLMKQEDYFNAKALLQSMVKNAKVPELKAVAEKKLEEAKANEKKQGKLKQD